MQLKGMGKLEDLRAGLREQVVAYLAALDEVHRNLSREARLFLDNLDGKEAARAVVDAPKAATPGRSRPEVNKVRMVKATLNEAFLDKIFEPALVIAEIRKTYSPEQITDKDVRRILARVCQDESIRGTLVLEHKGTGGAPNQYKLVKPITVMGRPVGMGYEPIFPTGTNVFPAS